jgi:hypothetical protein
MRQRKVLSQKLKGNFSEAISIDRIKFHDGMQVQLNSNMNEISLDGKAEINFSFGLINK